MNNKNILKDAISFCALILVSVISAKAGNTISVEDVSSSTIENPSVFISLQNDDDFTAIQFDLKISNENIRIADEITLNGNRLNDHNLSVRRRDDGSVRVVIGSLTNSSISSNEGYIAAVRLAVADSTEQSGILTVNNIIATNETGEVIKIEPSSSNVTFYHPTFCIRYLIDGEIAYCDSVKFKSTIIACEFPVKEGHTFSGWSEIPQTMPAGDITVTGSFIVNKYLLTYKVDGEVVSSDSISYGTSLTAKAEPVKEGHTFSGWSEIPSTMPAHDVTVTGSFIVNKYLLTYKVDGEVVSSDSISYGTSLTAMTEPVKEGHTFSGWSEIPPTMPAHDVTVTGSFIVNKYLLTYMVDGTIYHTDSIAYGTPIVLIPDPVQDGQTFGGWKGAPSVMPARDVVITGSFSTDSYTVIYYVDGEVYHTEMYLYGTPVTAIDAPVKEGHTFSGWSEIPSTMPAHDVTVTGSFSVNTYTVYYYVGDSIVHTDQVKYGDAIPEYVYEPSESRYTFIGWDGEQYSTMPAHDVVFIAMLTDGIPGTKTDDRSSEIYDLQGRRVQNPERGRIYIVNGRLISL